MRIISFHALALAMVCLFMFNRFCVVSYVNELRALLFVDLAVTTHDRDVFSFYPDNRHCNGFEEALSRYREVVPHVLLSGLSTSTASAALFVKFIVL